MISIRKTVLIWRCTRTPTAQAAAGAANARPVSVAATSTAAAAAARDQPEGGHHEDERGARGEHPEGDVQQVAGHHLFRARAASATVLW